MTPSPSIAKAAPPQGTPTQSSTEWVSLRELSRRLNRPYSTILNLASDGSLLSFGYRLHQTPHHQYKRVWVEIPRSL